MRYAKLTFESTFFKTIIYFEFFHYENKTVFESFFLSAITSIYVCFYRMIIKLETSMTKRLTRGEVDGCSVVIALL